MKNPQGQTQKLEIKNEKQIILFVPKIDIHVLDYLFESDLKSE